MSLQQVDDMPVMVNLMSLKDEDDGRGHVRVSNNSNNNNNKKVPLSAAVVGAGIIGIGSGIWSMQQAHHGRAQSTSLFSPLSSSSHGLEDLGISISNSSIGILSMSSTKSREPRMRGGSGETDVEDILEDDLDKGDHHLAGLVSENPNYSSSASPTTGTSTHFGTPRNQAVLPMDVPTYDPYNNNNGNNNDFEARGLPPFFLASSGSSSSSSMANNTNNNAFLPPSHGLTHPLARTVNVNAAGFSSLGMWASHPSMRHHFATAAASPVTTSKSGGGHHRYVKNNNIHFNNHHYHNNGRNTTTTRILLPVWSIGRIIGRGGDVINGIRDLSGAHITIMQSGTDNRSLQFRMVSVSGSISSVGLALQMIGSQAGLFDDENAVIPSNEQQQPQQVLGFTGGNKNNNNPSQHHHYHHLHALYCNEDPNSPDTEDMNLEDPGIRMVIDASLVGQLLGRKGRRVQEMRVQTGVRRIQVLNADESRVEGGIRNERIVVILGTAEQCCKVHQLISATLEMDMLQLQQLELEQQLLMQQQKQQIQQQLSEQFQQHLFQQQHHQHSQTPQQQQQLQQQQQHESKQELPTLKTVGLLSSSSSQDLFSSLFYQQQPAPSVQDHQQQQKDCSSKDQEEEKGRKDEEDDGEVQKEETTAKPVLSVAIAAAVMAASRAVEEEEKGGCDGNRSSASSSSPPSVSSRFAFATENTALALPGAPVSSSSSFPSFHTPSSSLEEDGASDSGSSNSSNANYSFSGSSAADACSSHGSSSMGTWLDEGGEYSSELVVRISNDNIGKLIGKEGRIIRRIRLESQCRIDIDSCPPTRDYLMRQVRVRGHIQHLQNAAAMIAQQIM